MSKRTRRADNSKRQQPTQQQRPLARQPGSGGPSTDTPAKRKRPPAGEVDTDAKS